MAFSARPRVSVLGVVRGSEEGEQRVGVQALIHSTVCTVA
jgi:hypothetical protein